MEEIPAKVEEVPVPEEIKEEPKPEIKEEAPVEPPLPKENGIDAHPEVESEEISVFEDTTEDEIKSIDVKAAVTEETPAVDTPTPESKSPEPPTTASESGM